MLEPKLPSMIHQNHIRRPFFPTPTELFSDHKTLLVVYAILGRIHHERKYLMNFLPSRPFRFFFELPDRDDDLSLLFHLINMLFGLIFALRFSIWLSLSHSDFKVPHCLTYINYTFQFYRSTPRKRKKNFPNPIRKLKSRERFSSPLLRAKLFALMEFSSEFLLMQSEFESQLS